MVGLLEAAKEYNPKGKASLAAFARPSIQWAMVAYLQTLTWESYNARAQRRKVEATANCLSGLLGRAATTEETAEALGISPRKMWALQSRGVGAGWRVWKTCPVGRKT